MPHALPAILRHIRNANRPQSHGAILLREIERLRAWIIAIGTLPDADTVGATAAAVRAISGQPAPTQETTDV